MGAFEGIRSETRSSPIISVPMALMRQGDFSEVAAQIRNPFTREPFPGNRIPQSMLSPTALRLLEYFPVPNRPGTAANYQGDAFDKDDADQVLLRVDQNVGNKIRSTRATTGTTATTCSARPSRSRASRSRV